nr:class I SAM-dependent methyltransferase [Kibdelosporangium sp. MJ126-NF4]CEL23295.1 Methyltransferase [Kibdelosporangium sp. MJ126-NF4]CTQ94457.1 Methyltransferase (EC 2.1.1.-) [Kibdelosporangium sp. MJ126-NF4]
MTDPDPELHARRANSFGGSAEQYALYRPGYAADAIDWVLPEDAVDVLDLGAGTGKLTEPLTGRGLNVTAVEPDPAMLAELGKRFPSATALLGTAEQIPLPDSSVDAVLVGQAFHWFDVPVALTEIGRVLRPAGTLGALWNDEDDEVPWVSTFDRLRRTDSGGSSTDRDPFGRHPLFPRFERGDFRHSVRYTIESLIGMVGTHSNMLVASAEERADAVRRMRAFLTTQPETSAGEFDFPFRTLTYRCKRAVTA